MVLCTTVITFPPLSHIYIFLKQQQQKLLSDNRVKCNTRRLDIGQDQMTLAESTQFRATHSSALN